MSECKFDFQMHLDPETIIRHIEQATLDNGGDFSGGIQSGRFGFTMLFGTIAGEYEIDASCFRLTITKKPALMSCDFLRQAITDFSRGKLV